MYTAVQGALPIMYRQVEDATSGDGVCTRTLQAWLVEHVVIKSLVSVSSSLPLVFTDMSGGLPSQARGPVAPVRMDSCVQDPQHQLLALFNEQNLRLSN